MKRGRVFLVLIILVFSISFISAGFFSDLFGAITGRATATCPDSDANSNYPTGLDYNTYGTFGTTSYHDYCVNETTSRQLKEIYCTSSGTPTIITYTCSIGCQSGACVGCVDYYADADNDGYGNSSDKQCLTIIQGIYKVTQTGDCNDGNSTIKPGATEICGDSVDNDCDSSIDEGCTTTTPETAPASSAPETTETIPEIADETPTINAELTQEFEGYIVELEGKPLIERELELEEQAETNEGNPTAQAFARILPGSIAPTTESNLDGKVSEAKVELETNRETIKTRIKNELEKTDIITGNAIGNSEESLIVLDEYELVFNGLVLNISSEEAEEIKDIAGIKNVTPNYRIELLLDDAAYLVNADDAWQLDASENNCATSGQPCLTGQGVTIGIIDTGVDYTHPSLGRCLGAGCKVAGGWDFVNNDGDPMDDVGHGTHVASTAAGNGDWNSNEILEQGEGFYGIAPDATIYAYKVTGSLGIAWTNDILSAIERSVDPNQDGDFSDHLDVISLSMGSACNKLFLFSFCSPDKDPLSLAMDNAVNAGVVAVVAAGNSGPESGTIGSPGIARKVITVGSSTKDHHVSDFSSRGPVRISLLNENGFSKPDVVAPGEHICAAYLDGNSACLSGTSMATPQVSGAVALLLQKNPSLTPEEVKTILKETAVDLGEDINAQGSGMIDILSAINTEPSDSGQRELQPVSCLGTDSNCGFDSVNGICTDCTAKSATDKYCTALGTLRGYYYKCRAGECVPKTVSESIACGPSSPKLLPEYRCSENTIRQKRTYEGWECVESGGTALCNELGWGPWKNVRDCGTTPPNRCALGNQLQVHGGKFCEGSTGDCYNGGWSTTQCPHLCINGECTSLANTAPCVFNYECGSSLCYRGHCSDRRPNGERCTWDNECASGICAGGYCDDPREAGEDCGEAHECISNICSLRMCGPLPNGHACASNSECASGKCRGVIPPTCRA